MTDAPTRGRHCQTDSGGIDHTGKASVTRTTGTTGTTGTSRTTRGTGAATPGLRAGGGFRGRRRSFAVVPVLAAAVGGSLMLSAPAEASTTWAALRQCESGGNYSTNSGNGYYGAYQFSATTWRSLGYAGTPSDAAPAVQDEAALRLAQRSGFGQWPTCGAGMGADQLAPGASSGGGAQASRSAARATIVAQPIAAASGAPALPFSTRLAHQARADVRAWQAQMNKIGYPIAVDGRYGPQSAAAARRLQAAKHLVVDGVVGSRTWAATFG
jgi:hypothetical protein